MKKKAETMGMAEVVDTAEVVDMAEVADMEETIIVAEGMKTIMAEDIPADTRVADMGIPDIRYFTRS